MKESHTSSRASVIVTHEQVREELKRPGQVPSFLAHHRMSAKFYRVPDDHHRAVHGLARIVIQEIIRADNRTDVIVELQVSTDLRNETDPTTLVLFSLIEYELPKDAQYLSRDKGIQHHLRNLNKDGGDVPAFIKSLGGIAETYAAYRAEKRGKSPRDKKPRANLKAEIMEACPGLEAGDHVGAILQFGKAGELKVLLAKKVSTADFDQASTDAAAADRRREAPAHVDRRPTAVLHVPLAAHPQPGS